MKKKIIMLACAFWLFGMCLFGGQDQPVLASETDTPGETMGNIYIRPDLPEKFRGNLEIQFKSLSDGNVYTCKINEYNYPYSTWQPMFYWDTIQVPCGSYEVIQCKVKSRGHYLYTTVPEKTIDVYQSWSGMFFPSVYDIEISEDEAEKICLDGETYNTQEPAETAASDNGDEAAETGTHWVLYLYVIMAVVLLVMFAVFGVAYKNNKIGKGDDFNE